MPKHFLWFSLLLAAPLAAADAPLLLLSRQEAVTLKAAIARRDPRVEAAARRLRAAAEAQRNAGPWSVTFHRPSGTPAGPHDFFSEGPYWWPNPANPSGPYIRRDGVVNPERFTANDRDLGLLGDTVFTLGLAAYLFDEAAYAGRAARLLQVWCVDEKTRMNPNLEFGQAIKNVTTGRGIGIIDSRSLIWAAQGAVFLRETGRWDPSARAAVEKWFAAYLDWLTHSRKGLDEKNNGNNHSTWWAVQVASLALFVKDEATERMAWDFHRQGLVPRQIRPDGSCPAEEARTKSLGYSAMNLDGFAMLCRLAEKRGVDLWHFRAPSGAGVEKALAYLAPFVSKPETWKKQQIAPFDPSGPYFLALAGMGLPSPEYLAQYRRLTPRENTWRLLINLLLSVREPA